MKPISSVLLSTVIYTLTACGGGGSDTPSTTGTTLNDGDSSDVTNTDTDTNTNTDTDISTDTDTDTDTSTDTNEPTSEPTPDHNNGFITDEQELLANAATLIQCDWEQEGRTSYMVTLYSDGRLARDDGVTGVWRVGIPITRFTFYRDDEYVGRWSFRGGSTFGETGYLSRYTNAYPNCVYIRGVSTLTP